MLGVQDCWYARNLPRCSSCLDQMAKQIYNTRSSWNFWNLLLMLGVENLGTLPPLPRLNRNRARAPSRATPASTAMTMPATAPPLSPALPDLGCEPALHTCQHSCSCCVWFESLNAWSATKGRQQARAWPSVCTVPAQRCAGFDDKGEAAARPSMLDAAGRGETPSQSQQFVQLPRQRYSNGTAR